MSLFATLERQPPDPLLSLIALHRADPRPDTIDVGVGVYRDERGSTPVMRAVKAAERMLVQGQTTKAYLGPEGDARFVDLLALVALGNDLAASPRLTGVQTPGGTGALRLAAETIARANPAATVWIGDPSWPIHAPIFREAGLRVATYRHANVSCGTIDEEALSGAFDEMVEGDILLVHACCHNPTGIDLSDAQWRTITARLADRGALPLIDMAYQGLGRSLDRDAAGMRILAATAPEFMLAYSCDKNFGLYRERTGALWSMAASPEAVPALRDTILVLARSLWSMPPDHGAAIVRTILSDDTLRADWADELSDMCARLSRMRALLADAEPAFAPLTQQHGMFSILPLDKKKVERVRIDHGIYMAGSGRINVAGLREDTVRRFAKAVTSE